MTFEQYAKKYLFENGMFEEQAAQVVEMAKKDEANESMKNRWGDDVEGYPPDMLSILRVSLNDTAVRWIDENQPKAWYRPMFANN